MAGLTAPGIGSGLDINGLVSQLMTFEQRPLTAMAQKEASFQSKLSAFGQIKSSLSSLQSAANKLKDAAIFSATKATVADTALFSASSSTTATAATYSIEVMALAREQRIATSATAQFAPTEGDLTITFGTVADGAFSAGPDAPKTLTFAGGSLQDFRDAINDADLNVTASVVNNGSAEQLVIKGKETGAGQAFQITGSTGLTYDPSAEGSVSSDPVYRLASAADALINVDGIDVSRPTNKLSDVIEGVTLSLKKAEIGTPTSLAIADDTSAATSAINAFVKAYNDLDKTLKGLTAFNAETRQASALTGDSAARSVQSQLRSMLGETLEGVTGTTRISDIGIAFDETGKLQVNSEKLAEALADPERNVAAFFTGTDEVKGFSARLSERIDQYITSDGLISGRTEGLTASIKRIDTQRQNLNLRLTQIEARYVAQFTALDSIVASMTQTSNYLSQQLATLPGAFSGG